MDVSAEAPGTEFVARLEGRLDRALPLLGRLRDEAHFGLGVKRVVLQGELLGRGLRRGGLVACGLRRDGFVACGRPARYW